MPMYFQLLHKEDGEAASLPAVDDELCAALGVVSHPIEYYCRWYDTIGLGLACGKTWDELREIFGEELQPIINWLESRYDVSSWRGK